MQTDIKLFRRQPYVRLRYVSEIKRAGFDTLVISFAATKQRMKVEDADVDRK